MRIVAALAVAASLLFADDAIARGRSGGRRSAPLASAAVQINDPYVPSDPFVTQTMDFNAVDDQIDLGNAVGNSWSNATIAYWFRHNSTSWPSNLIHLARNASNQRQFQIQQIARGGNGELAIGFSAGTTLVTCSVPDLTFRGPYWYHVVVVKSGSTLTFYVNGAEVALQNCSGTIPASVGSSTAPVRIGATGAAGSPASFYLGKLSNVAMWTGFSASATQVRALWGNGRGGVDYRSVGVSVPTPTWYVPGIDSPPTEVIVPITVGGNAPGTYSTTLPPIHELDDEMFSHRFVLYEGSEPWMFLADGTTSARYTASPSIVRLTDDRLMWTITRGSGHIQNHRGFFSYTDSEEALMFPVSERAWPLDASGYVPALIPHGDLTGAESSKRSMTLSLIPEIGEFGRIFLVFNETAYTLPTEATTAVSVTSNVATADVTDHTWAVNDWIYSTGHTQNAGDGTTPVQITAQDATHISYPLVRANGALDDGTGTLTKANPSRRVWVTYTDDDGATLSTPFDFAGGGLQTTASHFTSVGRARVIRRPDGSLLFPYYRIGFGEVAYEACMARSTNDGATWAYYSTIARSADRQSGAKFEEPFCLYIGANIRCQIRVDSGADPGIEGGASLNGVILQTTSTDHGATWPTPVKIYDGRHHPIFIYRPSDGLMLGVHGDAAANFPPRVRISRDGGTLWSAAQTPPSPFSDLNMQGDLYLSPANRIVWIRAQETDNDSSTRVWSDVFRETWIRSVETP